MGCGASILGKNGMVIPLKARPLHLFRLEEFKKRRHPQAVKDSSTSKKVLLMDYKGEDYDNHVASIKQTLPKQDAKDSSSLADDAGSCVTSEEGSKGGSPERECFSDDTKAKKEVKSLENDEDEEHDHETKLIEPLAKDNNQDEHERDDDEEEEDNDGRMIGHHEDALAFPGSPSFRVYFTDDNNGDNKIEDGDDQVRKGAPIDGDPKPLEVPLSQEVQKEKKRRSFKKVLPNGKQAKNLFNVRSCMSTNSSHNRAHLLTVKAHA